MFNIYLTIFSDGLCVTKQAVVVYSVRESVYRNVRTASFPNL